MNKPTKWRSGPPPAIGWWPASTCKDRNCLRWWNGRQWGHATYQTETAAEAEENATTRVVWFPQSAIKWTDRWWQE